LIRKLRQRNEAKGRMGRGENRKVEERLGSEVEQVNSHVGIRGFGERINLLEKWYV